MSDIKFNNVVYNNTVIICEQPTRFNPLLPPFGILSAQIKNPQVGGKADVWLIYCNNTAVQHSLS